MKSMKQKALFLTSRVPYPPNRGDRVRTYFLLKQFCESFDVTLLSLYESQSEKLECKVLNEICNEVELVQHSKWLGLCNVILSIFTRTPFQVAYYRNPNFKKALIKLNQKYEYVVIYTHLIRLAPYSELITKGYHILDYTDCISLEYKRSLQYRKGIVWLFFKMEALRTMDYELKINRNFNESWVISPVDLKHLNLDKKASSIVVPNPVNVCLTDKDYRVYNRIIFIGNMSVPHNIFAVKYVVQKLMPELLNRFSHLTFHIVGAHPVKDVLDLHNQNKTIVHGFVDDLYHEILISDIMVAPLFFSAGVQNKLLEAMACGIPVITTPEVAQSLDCKSGNELLTAHNPDTFIDNCINLLTDKQLRYAIGTKGKDKVAKDFSLYSIKSVLNSRFEFIGKSITQNLGEG